MAPQHHRFPADLFPPEVVVAACDPERIDGSLYPEEAVFVARAVAKRQQEFKAGRLLAREALRRLGVDEIPLRAGDDRQPLWPPGFVGSISHADGICGVAVTRRGSILGLGLDIEVADAVESEILDVVLRDEERQWLMGQHDQRRCATTIFSAKEAVYKGLNSIEPVSLEFTDVRIHFELAQQRFAADIVNAAKVPAPLRLPILGHFCSRGRWDFTGVTIPCS